MAPARVFRAFPIFSRNLYPYKVINLKKKKKLEISYQLHSFQAWLAQVSAEQKAAQECQGPSDRYVD